MEIRSITPKTIHVLGDSHALAFKRRSVEIQDVGMIFSSGVSYIRGIQPDTLAPNGKLNPEIGQYLTREGLIAPDGRPVALSEHPGVIPELYATGQGCQNELVVFHLGEIYVRKYLGSLFVNNQFDADVIANDFRAIVIPYVQSVRAIMKSFDLVAIIHDICPPTGDDEQFEKINKFLIPSDRRGLVYRIFNEVLAESAQKHGVMVCPSNDYLADQNGCLKAEYEFDGVHADPKYTTQSISRIARHWLCSRTSARTQRYNKWAEISEQAGDPQKISQIGITEPVQALDEAQVACVTESLGSFDYQICRKPMHDWSHAPPYTDHPKFHKMIEYGVVGEKGLKVLHDVFIAGPIGDSIRAHIGSRFAMITARAVRSVAHSGEGVGQQTFHRDACPPAIFRGLLYLVDVDENDGAFEYMPLDGSPDPKRVTGAAGSWILFDANVISHRATPPRTRTRLALDFVILAIPDEADELVNSADVGCIWPVDPYMFTLTERCYPRVKSKRWFYPSLVAAQPTKIKTL